MSGLEKTQVRSNEGVRPKAERRYWSPGRGFWCSVSRGIAVIKSPRSKRDVKKKEFSSLSKVVEHFMRSIRKVVKSDLNFGFGLWKRHGRGSFPLNIIS